MSYQPYPESGAPPAGAPGGAVARPQSVQNAVRLMYAGAALTVIEAIVGAATVSSVKNQVIKTDNAHGVTLTSSQVSLIGTSVIVGTVVGGIIGIVLWLWMSYVCGKGRSWGRILSTVFFAIGTLSLLYDLISPDSGTFTTVIAVLVWLAGLGAIIFLWQRPSSEFFQANRA